MAFAHTRNVEYLACGLEVDVLNFSAASDYVIDGIRVITMDTYLKEQSDYYYLVCHAANIRNHYKFIKKYASRFRKIIFFFHGHEVLSVNDIYPKDYPYVHTNKVKKTLRTAYDRVKCRIWKNYFTKTGDDFHCVFVSHWMYNEFMKWVGADLKGRYSIIYNIVSPVFIENRYDADSEKEYDYISIRSNLDGAKYCVDLVNKLAFMNPEKSFLLFGRGEYFDHNEKADNLIWENRTLNHSEVVKVLNKSRCALMPTRTDAQGVMACEFATFGIPMITSDIDVCHEVFEDFANVGFIRNDLKDADLDAVYATLKVTPEEVNGKYSLDETVMKEIELYKRFYK